MNGPDDDLGPLGGEFDSDAVLWVRGIDYVTGWRDAKNAAEELAEALAAAGIDTDSARLRADAGPDGSGVVHLAFSASTARDLALLARVTAARLRRAS
jgi:hypothetical protein